MRLVKIDNYELKFEDELLLLKPFRVLYNADHTKDKTNFLDFLSILYFVYDPRSEFNYIVDEDARIEEVCNANGIKKPKFTKQDLVCIELYKKMTVTASSLLLERTRKTLDRVGIFLENIDLTEEDDKGKPKYTVQSVVSSAKLVPQLVKEITEAERTVAKEIEESGRARGNNGSKKLMDDGILI